MLLRDDLRQLAVLTAVGVTLGCAHLALRPGLPIFAAPAAACTLAEPAAVEAIESQPEPEPQLESRIEDPR